MSVFSKSGNFSLILHKLHAMRALGALCGQAGGLVRRRIWSRAYYAPVGQRFCLFSTSVASKWDSEGHLEDDLEEIELELGFQTRLNTRTLKRNDQFIDEVLKHRKSRKFRRKLKTQYGYEEPPMELKQFDLNGLEMELAPREIQTDFDSPEAFTRYLQDILTKSYSDPIPFHAVMMGFVKGINSYQPVASTDAFNQLIRYLIRRGKWGRIFQLLRLMPLYGLRPNRDTFAWLLRGCHNNVDKRTRMLLVRSVLHLGIHRWNFECTREIKTLLWLALPYSKDWLRVNNELMNEGLRDFMDQTVVLNHYIRNMVIHQRWVKENPPAKAYHAIGVLFRKKGLHFPKDKVFAHILKDPMKTHNHHELYRLLTAKSIQLEDLDMKTHSGNALKAILEGPNFLLNSILLMNELSQTYPQLQAPLTSCIVQHLQTIPNSGQIQSLLNDNTSPIFALRWNPANWGDFPNLTPLQLALVEQIYRCGQPCHLLFPY